MLWCEVHLLIDRNASLSRVLSLSLSLFVSVSLSLSSSLSHTFERCLCVCVLLLFTQRFSLLLRLPLHLPHIHLYFWVLYTEPYPCAYNSHWTSKHSPPISTFPETREWNVSESAHIKTNPNTGYITPFWESKSDSNTQKNKSDAKYERKVHSRSSPLFLVLFSFIFIYLFISYILQFKVERYYIEQRQRVRQSFFFRSLFRTFLSNLCVRCLNFVCDPCAKNFVNVSQQIDCKKRNRKKRYGEREPCVYIVYLF